MRKYLYIVLIVVITLCVIFIVMNIITRDPIPDIPENCIIWADGCNSCTVSDGKLSSCTFALCSTGESYCKEFQAPNTEIPENCIYWHTGCNRCIVSNGKLIDCTHKVCSPDQKNQPHCLEFEE